MNATHTIVGQSKILVNPIRGIRTEIVDNGDGTWSFNWVSIFDGQVLPKKFERVFASEADAEVAREEFRESERKKLRFDFFIE
jgi:hypothetical protein